MCIIASFGQSVNRSKGSSFEIQGDGLAELDDTIATMWDVGQGFGTASTGLALEDVDVVGCVPTGGFFQDDHMARNLSIKA